MIPFIPLSNRLLIINSFWDSLQNPMLLPSGSPLWHKSSRNLEKREKSSQKTRWEGRASILLTRTNRALLGVSAPLTVSLFLSELPLPSLMGRALGHHIFTPGRCYPGQGDRTRVVTWLQWLWSELPLLLRTGHRTWETASPPGLLSPAEDV